MYSGTHAFAISLIQEQIKLFMAQRQVKYYNHLVRILIHL